ncbi:MAG: two-component regulator propeller domain-containing protein [bacterium]
MSNTRYRSIFLALFLVLIQNPQAQSVSKTAQPPSLSASRFGIFDATADWGMPESPPRWGRYKVPGRVEITETPEGTVYDLYGNGEQIFFGSDEGFYLYTERAGSWSLSGQVEWIESGNPFDPWYAAGPMIREKGPLSTSKCVTEGWGEGLTPCVTWREQENQAADSTVFIAKDFPSTSWGKAIYMRISRIAPLDLFYTEWSDDGVHWHFYHSVFVPMRDPVAYGFAIANRCDNEQWAHVRIRDVQLRPLVDIPPIVRRKLPSAFFESNNPIPVTLEIHNLSSHSQEVNIQESIPPDWSASRLSPGGEIHDATLSWKLTAEPGTMAITYQLTPVTSNQAYLSLHGNTEELPIVGDTDATWAQTGEPGPGFFIRRYWNQSDGLEVMDGDRLLFVNAGGEVLTHKNNQGEYLRLAGYQAETIPAGDIAQFPILSAAGEIWSVSFGLAPSSLQTFSYPAYFNRGLRQYKKGRWIAYAVPEIESATFPAGVLPGATDQVFIQIHDRILEFNAATRQARTVRASTPSLYQLPDLRLINSQEADGAYWLAETDGLVKMTPPSSGHRLTEIRWEKMPFDPAYAFSPIFHLRGNEDLGFLLSCRKERTFRGQFKNGRIRDRWKEDSGIGIRDEAGSAWLVNKFNCAFTQISPEGADIPLQDDFFTLQTTDIAADPRHGFWVATRQGIAKFSTPLWFPPPEIGGLKNPVDSICEDGEGGLWFSSNDRLIHRNPGGAWRIYHYPPNTILLIPKSSLSFLPDSGRLAIRLFISGWISFLYFDRARERFRIGVDTQGFPLQYFPIPSRNEVWKIVYRYINKLEVIRDDGRRSQIMAEIEEPDARGDQTDRVLQVEDQDDFWLTLDTDLRHYHGATYQSFAHLRRCRDMLDLGSGKKWCGKDELLEYDGHSWQLVRGGFGLIYQFLRSSDGSIWIASNNGLWRYTNGIWLQFGIEEGLPSNTVLCVFEDRQKQIWAGTALGVARFHPERDPDPPETLLTARDNVNKIAADTTARIVYTGLDRWKQTDTSRLLYSTRLDGKEWSLFTSETMLTAPGLAAGAHQLQVRAMDRNGNIDPAPAVWNFTVEPHWYNEPLFQLSILTSSLLVLFFAGYALHRHLNLGRLVAERTADLSQVNELLYAQRQKLRSLASELSLAEDRERRRLATDLHDRIGQSLTSCKIMIQSLRALFSRPGTHNEWDAIQDSIQQTIEDTRSLTFEISPPILYELGLEPAVAWVARQFQQKYGLAMDLRVEGASRPLGEDVRSFLFRSIRELLMNAVKHARARSVQIVLAWEARELAVTVTDDGVGMEPGAAQAGKGYGLFAIRERLTLLGGRLEISPACPTGMAVTLTLPVPENTEGNHAGAHSSGG